MRAIDYEDAIIERARLQREAVLRSVRKAREQQLGLAFVETK